MMDDEDIILSYRERAKKLEDGYRPCEMVDPWDDLLDEWFDPWDPLNMRPFEKGDL